MYVIIVHLTFKVGFEELLCIWHLNCGLKILVGSLKFQSYKNLWKKKKKKKNEILNPSLKNYCAHFLSNLGVEVQTMVETFIVHSSC